MQPGSWLYFWVVWACALALYIIELAYQYYLVTNQTIETTLIFGSAYAGGTLIALALFASAMFKWNPRLAKHWWTRRYLGVAGTACITIHAFSVYTFLFNWDLAQVYFSFNPFKNVIVFGTFAYTILFAMMLTSSDWAMRKMGRWWKFLHRFVYVGFASAIFHFMLTNPYMYQTPPGFLLVSASALAVFGQLFWFFKTIKRRRYKNAGTYVGFAIIAAVLITLYLAIYYKP